MTIYYPTSSYSDRHRLHFHFDILVVKLLHVTFTCRQKILTTTPLAMADSEVSICFTQIIKISNVCSALSSISNNNLFFLQIAKALKDLPLRIQSASIKEREKAFEDVSNVLSNSSKLNFELYLY